MSRALGPQLGGCIGVIFAIANIGMAALYIVGIAEFILDLLREAGYNFLTFGSVSDNRVFSLGESLLECFPLILKFSDMYNNNVDHLRRTSDRKFVYNLLLLDLLCFLFQLDDRDPASGKSEPGYQRNHGILLENSRNESLARLP